jgi:hypothetical protein
MMMMMTIMMVLRLVLGLICLVYYGVALLFLNLFKFPPSGMAGSAGGDDGGKEVIMIWCCIQKHHSCSGGEQLRPWLTRTKLPRLVSPVQNQVIRVSIFRGLLSTSPMQALGNPSRRFMACVAAGGVGGACRRGPNTRGPVLARRTQARHHQRGKEIGSDEGNRQH